MNNKECVSSPDPHIKYCDVHIIPICSNFITKIYITQNELQTSQSKKIVPFHVVQNGLIDL